MSGDWVIRRGGVFWPLRFAGTAMGTGMQMTHVSMGNLTLAFEFPNGPIPGAGGVTATGSAPAGLRVPRHRFVDGFGFALPSGGVTLAQLTTTLAADGPAATASLGASGGPGSFTWCPGDSACAAGGGALATDPPQGAGARNGRVIYRAGANRFGGVMQMLLRGHSVRTVVYASAPTEVAHVFDGPMGTQATGGAYESVRTNTQTDGFVTRPITFMAGWLIVNPGPKVTTMGGLTNTATGPTLTFPGVTTMDTGFPFTTGTVFAQQTAGSGGDDFFTAMGTDLRTALGAGQLTLVAGGLSLRSGGYYPTTTYASFQRVRMTLSAPVPSLSGAGIAAAAALMLLAVGRVRRGRSGG